MSDEKFNAKVYAYPDGHVDILCASCGIFSEGDSVKERPLTDKCVCEGSGEGPAPRQKGKKSSGEDRLRSVRRARAKLRRLALSNEFSYFVTLTLDPEKIDRFDGAAITRRLNQWCSNMVKRHGLRYIIVPEQHKDGAWHFHGFFAGEGLKIVDSGTIRRPDRKQPQRPRSEAERAQWLAEGGQIVYNLPQWPYGFSTALKLYGEYRAAVTYCTKYVGKQNGERPLGRWYYSGGALTEPEVHLTDIDFHELREQFGDEVMEVDVPIQGGKMLVIHTKQEDDCG